MKLLIASDIHGSALFCGQLMEAYKKEGTQRLLLLQETCWYHGPRNELPQGYAPKEVIRMLNEKSGDILCVRGNCEAEVDQMVLDFPVMADYSAILLDGITVYATHGHIWNEEDLPPLKKGDILLCGIILRVPKCTDHGNYVYMNPGSVSHPERGKRPRLYDI